MERISERKKSFFGKLAERLNDALYMHVEIDEDMMDEIEEILITSDIGMDTTMNIMEELRTYIKDNAIVLSKNVRKGLKQIIARLIDKGERNKLSDKTPLVIMMIGINGGGKTTTIAKLGNKLKKEGKTVMFAAADTFRAAAAEQLDIWGKRIGVNTVMHQEGADPSAVLFDAIQSAKAKHIDVLICDTAGRLQTKKNLMTELEKMNRVISREYPEADRETLLILDATNGKNAISQAKEFNEVAEISGVVITKLDGTAKGGVVIGVSDQFQIPVKYIGLGEQMTDLQIFNKQEFVKSLFGVNKE
jgi:fused signal recognition particle receptor